VHGLPQALGVLVDEEVLSLGIDEDWKHGLRLPSR
jgi:hypothetical protein